MSRKALNFDDAKIKPEQEAKKIFNSGDAKAFIERALKLEEQMSQTKADMKGLYDDAHEQGIDRKALKIVVKHKKNPMSQATRAEVNEIMTKVGE